MRLNCSPSVPPPLGLKAMKSLNCAHAQCPVSGKTSAGSLIRYGFYKTKSGMRRRFRCRTCGKTFCSNTGTPYHRLQPRRATFDEVATLSVEGLNKSAIARVKRIAWNTVHRWLQKAASSCRHFNDSKDKRIRHHGASGRRDSYDHPRQGTTHLDLRHDRGQRRLSNG